LLLEYGKQEFKKPDMAFSLSSKNVFDYLAKYGLCTEEDQAIGQIEPKTAKNFNLLLTLAADRKVLVKQEPFDRYGKTAGEFLREWRIYEFLQRPEFRNMQSWVPEVLHFDADNSILVVHYLADHRDLADFYMKETVFPPSIAASIGAMLGVFHRTTLERQEYLDFFNQDETGDTIGFPTTLAKGLQRIGPEIFGQVPDDGLKFYSLYQRYDSLGTAIAELCDSFHPCCLTHNDLKLNNILLPDNWEDLVAAPSPISSPVIEEAGGDRAIPIKLIDWERSAWGDPAFDLGMFISSYLGIWLGSLAVSKSIAIEEALRLAMTPLEVLQPSISALGVAYFGHFPEILQHRPDFLKRVVQFSGFALIQTILSMLQYQKSFGNTGICMLQVAKTLLCRPEQSVSTIFGMDAMQLTRLANGKVAEAP